MMNARLSAVGSLAALIFLAASAHAQQAESRPAAEPGDSAAATSDQQPPAQPAQPAAPAEAAQPPAAEQPAAPAEDVAAAEAAAETSVEDAAAAAGEIEAPPTKTIDALNATRKELEQYNATVPPDERILCKRTDTNTNTGSRMGKRACRTLAQWRAMGSK